MSAISQTIFSYAFLWMKSFVFWLKIYIGLDNGLAPNRRWAIIWTNADPIHWRIYAALRGMSLTYDDGGVGVVGGGVGWGGVGVGGLRVGGGVGKGGVVVSGPPTPRGLTPLPMPNFFLPTPAPFFRIPSPKIQIFCLHHRPSDPRPAHFQKPPTPAP